MSWEEIQLDPDDNEDYVLNSKRHKELISMDLKISLLSDVATALSAVHICGVIHGDIKPQNILLFRSQPEAPLIAKISDFGGCFDTEEMKRTDSPLADVCYSLAGTQYWNGPEAISRDDPDFGRETRDYYGLGLLALYILFEEPPFGDENDISTGNVQRIDGIKTDPKLMQQLLRAAFDSHWRLAGKTKEAVEEIISTARFYERQEKLKAFIETRQVFEVSKSGTSWLKTEGDEDRQYCFFFVISQFLRRDPSLRQQNNIMKHLRIFLSDKGIARSLRDIFLMRAWQTFWSVYEAKEINIWQIATLFHYDQDTMKGPILSTPREDVSLAWRTPAKNFSNEFSGGFDFGKFDQLPAVLKDTYLKELHYRSTLETGPSKIDTLLGLAYCETLGHKLDQGVRHGFLLEAAQLGSNIAKRGVLALLDINQITVNIQAEEHLRWLYDIVLAQMPSREDFEHRMMELHTDAAFHTKIVRKVFEIECLHSKVVGKRSLDPDHEDLRLQAAFESCKNGDLTTLRRVIESDSGRVKESFVQGYNLLHTAVEYGRPQAVQLLRQEYGFSLQTPTKDNLLPAVIALRAHDLDTLAALLSQGVDYEEVLDTHTLRCIANYGGPRALRLISNFISIWTKVKPERGDFPQKAYLDGDFSVREVKVPEDEPDFPPIFAAILGDNLGTLWSLLEMGCSTGPIAEFSSGQMLAPVHVAANLRPIHLALLLHHGADPNLRTADESKLTALHIACVAHSMPRYLFPRVRLNSVLQQEEREDGILNVHPADHVDTNVFAIRVLCGFGADINAQDWVGRTALAHCMSDPKALPIAGILVEEYHAEIQIKDFRGLSCLHRAVLHQSTNILIDFCLDKGADIDNKDINGLTPLMMAVTAHKNIAAVRVLVVHGASVLATQNKGWTALDLAIRGNFDEAAEYLFQHIAMTRELMPIIARQKDVFQQTPVHHLIYGKQSMFERHIKHFPPDILQDLIHQYDIVGFTLLHHAILARNTFAIEYLLSQNADSNAKGWRMLRPLHLACGIRAEDVFALLKNAGANLQASDVEGRIPSSIAESAAGDVTFWPTLMQTCLQDGNRLASMPRKEDLDKAEDDNRARARNNDRW
ncbi:MAG: hypothetical protein Q9223_000892 [Gallowayella weberi]